MNISFVVVVFEDEEEPKELNDDDAGIFNRDDLGVIFVSKARLF
jgi:hypothetical protein